MPMSASKYEYQPGDIVRCLDAHNVDSLVEGQEYVVDGGGIYIFSLVGVVSFQYTWRFVKIGHRPC